MSKNTIFLVTIKDKGSEDVKPPRLVDTSTANQAERHVISETVTATRATTREVAELMKQGVDVETVGE